MNLNQTLSMTTNSCMLAKIKKKNLREHSSLDFVNFAFKM